MRIVRMRNQRNAGRVKAGILGGAGNFLAEFRGEFAEYRRDMNADFFKDAPLHHRHHAAAARRAAIVGALPGGAGKLPGRALARWPARG
jgi:hypothetical protein